MYAGLILSSWLSSISIPTTLRCVRPAHHRRGHGTALAQDIEQQAAIRGASVIILSTSDATHATSLSDIDLYADPIGALGGLTFKKDHPVRFWQKIGYSVVGVVPDAEGPGIPSISLARRPRVRRSVEGET